MVSRTQFPLWEFFKKRWSKELNGRELYHYESAICGSAAGMKEFFLPLNVTAGYCF